MSKRQDMLRRLDQDIRDHIERETQDNIARGMSPEEARCAALRRFGNVQLIKEETRAVWVATATEQLWQDVKYGLRTLWRNKTFTVIAVLTLAIGIAVNAAVFSVVDAVVLRTLPYPDANDLVAFSVGVSASKTSHFKPGIAGADLAEWRAHATSFDKLAGYTYADKTIAARNVADQVRVVSVAGDFWAIVGAEPLLGHLFEPDKDRNDVVLSHSLFAGQFKGDRRIIGTLVALDGKQFTVAGVLPQNFRFYFPQDWWSGLTPAEPGAFIATPPLVRSTPYRLFVVGRLKQSVPASHALAEIQDLETSILRTYPDRWFPGIPQMKFVPLQRQLLGTNRQGLFILQAAGVLVLVIACVNVANLLLARGASRLHEIAIRTAIGAGTMRVLRQFLTEGIVLALFSGIAGLLVTKWMLVLFIHFGPQSLPRLAEISIDARVMGFALLLCLGSGVLFGFGPAATLWNTDVQNALKQGGKNSSGSAGGFRIRRILVASEIALALVLMTGTGLMVKSFWRMYKSPSGFDPDHTLLVKIALSGPQYTEKTQKISYLRELLDRLRSLPGIDAFGIVNAEDYIIQSKDPSNPALVDRFRDSLISPGYFHAVGMHLVKGRVFYATDPADATVINETMAHRVFGDRDPIGKRIEGLGRPVSIVGVVGNLKYARLDADPGPEIFRAYASNLSAGNVTMTLIVRMCRDPLGLAPTLRRSIGTIDPTQPVYDLETLQHVLSASVAVRRFELFLLAIFAVSALLMALIGVYGVIAYSVTQRTKEIGVRMAVGAQRRQVVTMIVRQGLSVGVWGIAIGTIAAYGFTRVMVNLLYGVAPHDPVVLLSVAASLLLIVALACTGPALRAAVIDPLVALRHE